MEAIEIITKMMHKDEFSQWLGIQHEEIEPGISKLIMTIRPEMCNGFGIAHGGITYSLADSALAFASNSRGKHALSIETSISHIHPCYSKDVLTAVAEELSLEEKRAIYQVKITNQNNQLVALFKGTVYRKQTDWE
jgi:acyl-CoA thioesterase